MPDLIRHPVFSMDSGFRRNDEFIYLIAGVVYIGQYEEDVKKAFQMTSFPNLADKYNPVETSRLLKI
jgi:hypothetical protein